MPEEIVQDPVEAVVELTEEEKESDAAFDSGFEGTVETPTENTPPAEVVEPKVESKVDEPAPKQDVPAAPALTDAQLQEILAKVKTVDQFGAVVEKLRGDAFGKIGGLERTLKQILEQGPSGQPIEVKPEDLKGIEAEFPGLNLAPVLAKDLTAVLGKIKPGGVQKGISQEEIDAIVNARVAENVQKIEQTRIEDFKQIQVDRLTDMHEDWQEVIGPENSENEFRTWLKTNKPDQEKAFYESWNARFIGKMLTEFKKSKGTKPEPPKPKVPTREQRLAQAIPAKGGGVASEKPKRSEEEDAFDAGFSGQ